MEKQQNFAIYDSAFLSNTYSGAVRSYITRYGNVIGSRGSVSVFFIEQVNTEKPIRVTD